MKKKLFSLFTSLIMVISLVGIVPVMTANAETYGDYVYSTLGNGTVRISSYIGKASKISIPTTINRKKVTSIGENAFYFRNTLKSVTIPNSVTSIGTHAFSSCDNLTSITIPGSVKSIGERAFAQCSKLKNVKLYNGVKSIGQYAFQGCKSLTSFIIPVSVTSIGDFVFEDSGIKSLIIGNGLKAGFTSSFYNMRYLESVTIGNNVKVIGSYSFNGSNRLKKVIIGNHVTSIGAGAFQDCISLTSISLPNSVKSIGNQAFIGCKSFTSITIPKSVTNISNGAFGISYAESINKIGANEINPNFKIRCYSGTYAEKYAKIRGITYELLDVKAPATVTGFKATTTTNAAKLTWNKVSGANGYIVYQQKSGKWTRIKTLNATSLTVSKLNTGASYRFAIKAYKKAGTKKIVASAKFPILTAITKLSAVSGFKATTNENSVKLTWNKVSGAAGYIVYQQNNGKWVRITTSPETSFTVSNLNAGTSYKFAVKPYKTIGNYTSTSATFPTVTVSTKLPKVNSINAVSNENSIELSWDQTAGAEGYVVYQKIDGSWTRIDVIKNNSIIVNDLEPDTEYSFAVRAYKTVNEKEVLSVSFDIFNVKTTAPEVV